MRSLIGILAVICLSVFVRPAYATDIPYTFFSGTKATFADGNLEFISGSFVVTAGGGLTTASVTLSGTPPASGNPPEAGLYNFLPELLNPKEVIVNDPTNTYMLELFFNADLTTPGFRGLIEAIWAPINNLGLAQQAVTRGGVCAPGACDSATPVPEPSPISLLIPALGLFLLRKWRPRQLAA